jgi:hypothetical protein
MLPLTCIHDASLAAGMLPEEKTTRKHEFMQKAMMCIALFAGLACAETMLAGKIGGMSFSPEGNPYIVTENVTVQQGASATVNAGCVFLFQPFTGMIIEGNFIVNGTLDNPVVFTSVNDSAYSAATELLPNPFDWNGVLVRRSASKVSLSNFILAYSVYGIKSDKEEFSIENGTFKANGQFHVTVNDAIKPVVDGLPFTYNDARDAQSQAPAGAQSFRAKVPSILIGSAGLLAGALGAAFTVKFFDTRKQYSAERNFAAREDLQDRGQTQLVVAAVAGGVAVAAIPTAIILWIRGNKQSAPGDQSVMAAPSIDAGRIGLTLSGSF